MLDLNEKAKIYEFLKGLDNEDNWWTRLKKDKDIYIDIRQDNTINIYHNGGSILRISSPESATINKAYLPAGKNNTYATCKITGNDIELKDTIKIKLDNFDDEKIAQIKKIIENYYPKNSEKGIQGAYATMWKKDNNKEKFGFFIDTELQYENRRIDLIYLYLKDPNCPKLYFVELKTKEDDRLWNDNRNSNETKEKEKENICKQLEKYKDFINEHRSDIISYYKTLYRIKKDLGLIPKDAYEINIDNLTIENKPVLLIGDATDNFIYKAESKKKELSSEMEDLKSRLEEEDYACMIICRGTKTNTLNFHGTQSGNVFMINPQNNNEVK